MQLLLTIVVCLFAGAGAGLGTGFAGMSAAAVITPMLVTFLHIEPYTAVGIALASDVLASAVSAYTYGRNRNLDIRNGLIMMITVLAFTVVGSLVSSLVPSVAMGNFSVIMTLLLGIKFIVRPVMTTKEDMQQIPKRTRIIKSIVCGAIVGFIMTFTALTGSVSHFAIGGAPQWLPFFLCIIFTFGFAQLAARIANRASAKTLNRATGVILVILGVVILGFSLLE